MADDVGYRVLERVLHHIVTNSAEQVKAAKMEEEWTGHPFTACDQLQRHPQYWPQQPQTSQDCHKLHGLYCSCRTARDTLRRGIRAATLHVDCRPHAPGPRPQLPRLAPPQALRRLKVHVRTHCADQQGSTTNSLVYTSVRTQADQRALASLLSSSAMRGVERLTISDVEVPPDDLPAPPRAVVIVVEDTPAEPALKRQRGMEEEEDDEEDHDEEESMELEHEEVEDEGEEDDDDDDDDEEEEEEEDSVKGLRGLSKDVLALGVALAGPYDVAQIAAACPNLRTLTLHPRCATGVDLSPLTALTALQSLEIIDTMPVSWIHRRTGVETSALTPLTALQHLTHLAIRVDEPDELYSQLVQLSGLCSLSLHLDSRGPHQFHTLASLQQLTRLCIRTHFAADGQQHPRYSSDLSERHQGQTAEHVTQLCRCSQLVRLQLPENDLGADSLLLLAQMPNLTRLEFKELGGQYSDGGALPSPFPQPCSLREMAVQAVRGWVEDLVLPPGIVLTAGEVEWVLGPAEPSVDDVAAVARHLALAARQLHTSDLTLRWGDAPDSGLTLRWGDAPDDEEEAEQGEGAAVAEGGAMPAAALWPADIIGAIGPLEPQLSSLALAGRGCWPVGEELQGRVAGSFPRLSKVSMLPDDEAGRSHVVVWEVGAPVGVGR